MRLATTTRGRRGISCNNKSEAVLKISEQCFLSVIQKGKVSAPTRMGGVLITYLRSSLAFCTAAKAAALTFEASRPEGRAQTRHIGQLAGWSLYDAGTWIMRSAMRFFDSCEGNVEGAYPGCTQ